MGSLWMGIVASVITMRVWLGAMLAVVDFVCSAEGQVLVVSVNSRTLFILADGVGFLSERELRASGGKVAPQPARARQRENLPQRQ